MIQINYGGNLFIGMIIPKMNFHLILKKIPKEQFYNQMYKAYQIF